MTSEEVWFPCLLPCKWQGHAKLVVNRGWILDQVQVDEARGLLSVWRGGGAAFLEGFPGCMTGVVVGGGGESGGAVDQEQDDHCGEADCCEFGFAPEAPFFEGTKATEKGADREKIVDDGAEGVCAEGER